MNYIVCHNCFQHIFLGSTDSMILVLIFYIICKFYFIVFWMTVFINIINIIVIKTYKFWIFENTDVNTGVVFDRINSVVSI